MPPFSRIIELVGLSIDAAGVAVIVIGLAAAGVGYIRSAARGKAGQADSSADPYTRLRQNVGRAILIGLELLVAADIIRTVVVDPTLGSVAVLGMVVLIRTFLSLSIQLELEGRWPWQRPGGSHPVAPASP